MSLFTELEDMEAVRNAVSELMGNEDFKALDTDLKCEKMIELLTQGTRGIREIADQLDGAQREDALWLETDRLSRDGMCARILSGTEWDGQEGAR